MWDYHEQAKYGSSLKPWYSSSVRYWLRIRKSKLWWIKSNRSVCYPCLVGSCVHFQASQSKPPFTQAHSEQVRTSQGEGRGAIPVAVPGSALGAPADRLCSISTATGPPSLPLSRFSIASTASLPPFLSLSCLQQLSLFLMQRSLDLPQILLTTPILSSVYGKNHQKMKSATKQKALSF